MFIIEKKCNFTLPKDDFYVEEIRQLCVIDDSGFSQA